MHGQGLSWVGKHPDKRTADYQMRPPRLHVGGLVNDEHVRWLEQGFEVNEGDELLIKVVDAEAADAPVRREPQEIEGDRRSRAKDQLNAARALLPSPLTEGGYLASIKGFEEVMANDRLELAVEVLGDLGDLNDGAPEFWEELKSSISDLRMYHIAERFRKRLK
jgi:hypothetical protein